MKGHSIIPILAALLVVPLSAQNAQLAALDRAKDTIDSADSSFQERQSAVLGTTSAPNLPDSPTFEVPDDQVFLDLPGSADDSTQMSMDAETISVDFPEEDVRDIIRSVSELYELNVVIPDTLAGSVSIKLRDVTWQQVFDVVLEPLNYTYIVDGNIIKIKSQDELAVEPVDTRVFIVDFANAGEIRASIEPLIDAASGGKIQVDTRSNALVITERPSRMNDIQEIIETLDRPTEQVMIESKFIEITNRDNQNKGVDWQSLAGYKLEAGPMNRFYSKSEGRNIGANMNAPNLSKTVVGPTDSPLDYGEPDVSSGTAFADNWWFNSEGRDDSAVFSAEAFSLVISALEKDTEVELVSNPTVVTMNNTPASINIGEEYPIPEYTYNDERGTFEVSNFEWKNIGINLQVTPQINSAGFINMNVQPEISSRSGEVLFGGASGAVIPIITTRKTVSTVTVKSGYTLAIGGLLEKNGDIIDSKVPVVGDIPIIGRVFSSTTKDVYHRNLIVFITAKILSASGATYEDVFDAKTLYEMGIKTRDVPGQEVSEQEMKLYEDALENRDKYEELETELKLRKEIHMLDRASGNRSQDISDQRSNPDEYRMDTPRKYKGED
ncbi:MAG: secretin N-terminal domain-containing protein [Puniceicoccaceae bacterium]